MYWGPFQLHILIRRDRRTHFTIHQWRILARRLGLIFGRPFVERLLPVLLASLVALHKVLESAHRFAVKEAVFPFVVAYTINASACALEVLIERFLEAEAAFRITFLYPAVALFFMFSRLERLSPDQMDDFER